MVQRPCCFLAKLTWGKATGVLLASPLVLQLLSVQFNSCCPMAQRSWGTVKDSIMLVRIWLPNLPLIKERLRKARVKPGGISRTHSESRATRISTQTKNTAPNIKDIQCDGLLCEQSDVEVLSSPRAFSPDSKDQLPRSHSPPINGRNFQYN